MTNQDRFLYAVGTKIQGLCDGPPPAPPTSDDALSRGWFVVLGGAQPGAVNNWVASKVLPGLRSVGVPYTFKPAWGNAFSYMAALDVIISNFKAQPFDSGWPKSTATAWAWFNDQPFGGDTQGEIPMEVIGWVANNLPIVVYPGSLHIETKPGQKKAPAGANP